MSKYISNKNIFQMARDFKKYVESNKKVPFKFTYDGVEFNKNEMQDILTYALLFPKTSGVKADTYNWCKEANGDNIVEDIYIDDYLNQAQRVRNYILSKGQVPNNVQSVKSKKRVNIDLYTYCVAKILVWYKDHGNTLPNYCTYDYRALSGSPSPSPSPTPQKSRSEKILDEFENYFGKCQYIDDALAKIRGRGYAFYFSDGYNMSETIKRMYNGKGANCYDSAEVFYHLALGMNTKYGRKYEPQYLHVWCPVSGYDHIRLRFKSNGSYFYRDPASVLDGGSVESNWCGTSNNIIEVNPSFIMDG